MHIKKQLIEIVSLIAIGVLSFTGCKKKDNTLTGNGKIVFNGKTYIGNWQTSAALVGGCGGIDIVFINTDGNNTGLVFSNFPQASNGSFSFSDGYVASYQTPTCNLFAITAQIGPSNLSDVGSTQGGNLTKTGTNSFQFSCILTNPQLTTGISVTGSGSF